MNNEKAKKMAEGALNRLMAALEAGRSEALKTYLAVMARFHRYSWGNALLIASQRPAATRVAGFHAWLKLRRYVRKGEKGIVILAPMVGRKRTHDELTEGEQTRVFGFRAAYVFDVSQTDGEPLPEFATVNGDPQNYTDRLKSFVAGKRITLEYSDRIAPAKGMSSGGRITLLPDLSAAEQFSVLVHETAHELLHKAERRPGTTPKVRETEAEAVAFVVSSAIGLDVGTSSSDYIQLYAGDKATLTESLAVIQQTAAEILQAIHSAGGRRRSCRPQADFCPRRFQFNGCLDGAPQGRRDHKPALGRSIRQEGLFIPPAPPHSRRTLRTPSRPGRFGLAAQGVPGWFIASGAARLLPFVPPAVTGLLLRPARSMSGSPLPPSPSLRCAGRS